MENELKPASSRQDAPVLFLLLGASNLHRGYLSLVNCLKRSLAPRRVEFLHAMGPGRAYCAAGGLFHVRYPGIGTTGIIEAAKQRKKEGLRLVALVTDIGSDILYNVPVADILATLERIFKELIVLDAEVFVTEIPVDFKKDIHPWQFACIKRLYFPRSSKSLVEVNAAVDTINSFLRQSAKGRVHLLPNMQSYCGLDKIHYRLLTCHRVWAQVAAAMLEVLGVAHAKRIGLGSTAQSLFSSMGRVLFCDLAPVRDKPDGTF